MAGVTAKDLMEEQQRRFIRQKQKEQDKAVTEDAKAIFHRPPYPGLFTSRDRYHDPQVEYKQALQQADARNAL